MTFTSAIYEGVVTHARFGPRPHRLAYRIFMFLLDLDEAPALDRALRLFSVGRFNLVGFNPRRHGDGSKVPLKAQVEARFAAAGLATGGPVRMLCMPLILGGGFNPLTVYYGHAADGRLAGILYEVNNTFGERHAYLIPAPGGADREIRQSAGKAFYVSPFLDMDLAYGFRLRLPEAEVLTAIDVSDRQGRPVLAASFSGRRRELSDSALLRAWAGRPWMTLGVLAAIHWEALGIWLKGEPIRPRTPTPGPGLTVVTRAAARGL